VAFKDDPAKAIKYLTGLEAFMKRPDWYVGPFKAMVKSGEVQFSSHQQNGEFFEDSTRPRLIMSPQNNGFMMVAAVMSQLYAAVRDNEPSFIHAMNSEQLAERFES